MAYIEMITERFWVPSNATPVMASEVYWQNLSKEEKIVHYNTLYLIKPLHKLDGFEVKKIDTLNNIIEVKKYKSFTSLKRLRTYKVWVPYNLPDFRSRLNKNGFLFVNNADMMNHFFL